MYNISIYIKGKHKNGFVNIRLLNYVIYIDITDTKLRLLTTQRSVNHKMWGYTIYRIPVYRQFAVFAPIFENCEFFGKSHQWWGGANLSRIKREEVKNLNVGRSPRVQLVRK